VVGVGVVVGATVAARDAAGADDAAVVRGVELQDARIATNRNNHGERIVRIDGA